MRLALIGALALLASCDSPGLPEDLFLAVRTVGGRGGSAFRAGDSVEIRIQNVSAETLYGNECYAELQRLEVPVWSTVRAASELPCPDYKRILAPGAETSITFRLPAAMLPGTHRYVFTAFYREDLPTEENAVPLSDRLSNTFSVVGGN